MPEPPRRPLDEISYRIVCYELEGDQQSVILDATARGFIAVTGTIAETARCTGMAPTPGRSPCDDGSPV